MSTSFFSDPRPSTGSTDSATSFCKLLDDVTMVLPSVQRTVTVSSNKSRKRSKGGHRRQRSNSEPGVDMISPREYHALPPQLQQKYFSSKERLDITQKSAMEKRKKKSSQKLRSDEPPCANLHHRPKTSSGQSHQHFHLHSRSSRHHPVPVSAEEAKWFSALPEKIRRQQFSREEQLRFAARHEESAKSPPTTPPDSSHRRHKSAGRLEGATLPTRPKTSSSAAPPEFDVEKIRALFDKGVPRRKSGDDVTPDHEIEIFKLYSRRDSDTSHTESEVTRCDSLHPPLPPLQPPPPPPVNLIQRRQPIRPKSIKLAPIRLPPPKLAPPPKSLSPGPIHPFAASVNQLHSFRESNFNKPSKARSHDDLGARIRLRHGLSMEKMDESPRFDFTPTHGYAASASSTQLSFPLQQAAPSPNMDEDCHSLGPTTPNTVSDDGNLFVKQPTSFDSGVGLPLPPNPSKPPAFQRSPSNSIDNRSSVDHREMPIRMTLTRPDLHIPDFGALQDDIYTVQRKQTTGIDINLADPLALEELLVCDDATGAHGAFAVRDSANPKGLKRVWKSIKKH